MPHEVGPSFTNYTQPSGLCCNLFTYETSHVCAYIRLSRRIINNYHWFSLFNSLRSATVNVSRGGGGSTEKLGEKRVR